MAINGKPVKDPNSMLNMVAALVPGKTAAVKLRRAEKDLDLQVDVGRRPALQQRR
jgi:S1-C subfamily serine protease